MTSISIDYQNQEVTVTGHAGYAPQGQDIVCAAVSALFVYLSEGMKYICKTEHEEKPGKARLKALCSPEDPEYGLLLRAFADSAEQLAEEYPDYVRIKII